MKIGLLPLACLGFLSMTAQAGDAPAAPPPGQAVRAACAADFKRFCSEVQPGGGRIRACIAQHRDELSDGCRDALQRSRAHRLPPRNPGGQGASDQPATAPKPQQ
ncbi:MAG TPA: cysteine rich repeat-containing protein [Steroidobacteraceae bacterium]|nr:cysteine rich repeat-containing protein [Steroidobacteraceae bacterium]